MKKTNLWRVLRAGEWWEFKLAPVCGTFYATAWLLQLPLVSLWPLLLLALAAIACAAAYVSIINDFADFAEDEAAGKDNRLRGRSRSFVGFLLACCVLPGAIIIWSWRGEPLLSALYLSIWIVFSLYSLPPFRLKNRGIWGVLADATGANVLPHLLVAALVMRRSNAPIDWTWLLLLGAWAGCYGLRGILWHQLSDMENDARSGVQTFVQLHDVAQLQRVARGVLFPLELVALGALLWRAANPLSWEFLCVHLLMEWARVRLWKMHIVIITPRPRYHLALYEFYEAFYPLAFLLAAALMQPRAGWLLALHLALFPRRALQIAKHSVTLLRDARRAYIHRRLGYR